MHAHPDAPAGQDRPGVTPKRVLAWLEDGLVAVLLLVVVALPTWAFVGRLIDRPSGAAIPLAQHATLLLAFAGAVLAARERKLLRLATVEFIQKVPSLRRLTALAPCVSAATSGLLARASWELIQIEREWPTAVAGLFPLWPLLLVLPLAFLTVGARLSFDREHPLGVRWAALACLAAGALAGGGPLLGVSPWPMVGLLLLAGLLGAPIFVVLAGVALAMFFSQGFPDDPNPGAVVPTEMLQLAISPFLPAIPLFTLAGLLLTEGAARRLLDVFRAWFGWVPGGTAVVVAMLCAFFSVFTGGSGVTILALGGLLFTALQQDGYREKFSLGLLTGAGALGILLPPALPLILYGIAAEVPIQDMFVAGILPGILLIGLVALYGVRAGLKAKVPRTSFTAREALASAWRARYELVLPFVTLGLFLSGLATLLEAAAGTVVYVLVVQMLVRREVGLRELAGILRECGTLVGGVLIILCAAKGLSYYFVDAMIPTRLLAWVQASVESKWVFLLALNAFLLVVGCFLDIYSATFVIVPLLIELGAAYGIDPVHLGILFIANLELGYLTPPVGLNLFLASYRFERPLLGIARASFPVFLILLVGVLAITYIPWLTTVLVR